MADLQSRTEFISTFKEVAKQVAQVGPDAGCLVHVPQAISNLKVLPQEFPVPAPLSCDLQVTACPGEYEPATFVLYAVRDLANVTVEVSDLVDGPRRLPGNVVDVRVVKCWYQSGTNVGFQNQRLLVPDLLLKDDELVRVDLEKQENFLREVHPAGEAVYLPISTPNSDHLANIHPRDAHHLRPVTLPADSAKQFWLTVHVPPDARPGDYRGTIRLQAAGGNPSAALRAGLPTLHLSLRVLPFPLAAPGLIYSIYYRGVLTPDGQGSISSEQKSPEQYLAEMKNLAAHGVLYPTAYQGYDEALLRPVVQLREQAGLSKGRFFGLGRGTGSPRDQAELDRLAADVKKWRAFLSPFGYHQVYFYGIDEASGEALAAQRAAWKAVHRAGGKTFVACYHGTFEAMGVLLDVAVYAGPPDAHEAKKYHRVRRQIFCYANPQVGVEEPETYRRNFGLLLWKAGYDGAMDYAYQHSFHHIWNDFDDPTYRDHNFTYPTEDGVIDTVEWEGFREGVDDVRYVTTLERCLESAPAGKRKVAKQAREWLDALDPQTADLHETRAKMVEWILRLRQ
jgi:hypothetical protein